MINCFGKKTISNFALLLAGLGLITACETVDNSGGSSARNNTVTAPEDPAYEPPTSYDEEEFVTTESLGDKEPVRIALLLPFSANSESVQKVAQGMANAAELAVFESGNERLLLISKDTKGTVDGARIAASEALREGAEVVLGPLFSDSVMAASALTRAAGVPMIAFSSDMRISGNGVYLLSFPPEMEIARVTDYAVNNGFSRFGMLTPETEYGQRVSSSFAEEAYVRGGIVVHEESYARSPDAMMQPVKRLADYATPCTTVVPDPEELAEQEAYRNAEIIANGGVIPEPEEILEEEMTDGMMGDDQEGFQAVLVPEQGTLLRALAPLLPYYDVNVKCIKLLGVSAWNNPRLTREPALSGGWFAAPDPTLSENFKDQYSNVYGDMPPRLASLAYDAALLTARLGDVYPVGQRYTGEKLADPNGYLGADGLFRLTPEGRVERGLAILEIRSSGIKVIDPAPSSFIMKTEEEELAETFGLDY